MELKIMKYDNLTEIFINGKTVENVMDYEIKNSVDGTTELKIKFKSNIFILETQANSKLQKQ